MFEKRHPREGEKYCPYDNIFPYSSIPGYHSARGCPVCGGIATHHVPVPNNAPERDRYEAELARGREWTPNYGWSSRTK